MLFSFSTFRSRFFLILWGIVLLFAALRWPLLDVPMERDEGEYATIGLGILHGIPPYAETYTMKLPGAASLHALIFWFLGPTVRSVHLALLFINTLTIGFVGILGRRLLGISGGLFAAAAYGTLTLGMGMFGLWLSAEHFAVMFLLGGACLIPPSLQKSTKSLLRLIGGAFLLGASIVVKQHALLPALAWLMVTSWLLLREKSEISRQKRFLVMGGMVFTFALPFIFTCLAMIFCGVFENFRFWTFQYASRYVTAIPFYLGWEHFKMGISKIFVDAPLLWIFAGIGFGVLLLKARNGIPMMKGLPLLLLTASFVAAISVSAGFMFRGQYFILLAPYAALLAGVTWQFLFEKIQLTGWRRNWIGVCVILACFVVLLEPFLFGIKKRPDEICRLVYGMNPFPEYQKVASYIQKQTRPHEKVAVLGSEPAIYFLADRRPAMPYLCVYEMMKPHPYAKKMQEEAVRCLKQTRPHYIVMINVPTSWGIKSGADPFFLRWIKSEIPKYYTLDGLVDLISETETTFKWGKEVQSYEPKSPYTLMIFRRKDGSL